MSIHISSVNHKNLIKDLAQMYPEDVSEVIVAELIANSLDSKADCIKIDTNPIEKTLVISDNGKGMSCSQFNQYHDFAAGLKVKGQTIGFAGVGAKISFNIACRVKTETRSSNFTGGSDWHFNDGEKLIWEDIKPNHIPSNSTGTRVEIHFPPDFDFPYSDKYLSDIIKHHYLPLLDKRFLELYGDTDFYPISMRFVINGNELPVTQTEERYSLEKVKDFYPANKKGNKVGFGIFGLSSEDYPISQSRCGIMLCTYGKVIKSELFRQFTGQHGSRILGIVEIPKLINFLNTSKSDFTCPRGKGRTLEALLDPVRKEFKDWLSEIGVSDIDTNHNASEIAKLEREINKMIPHIPELSELFSSKSKIDKALVQNNEGDIGSHPEEGINITYPSGQNGNKNGKIGPVTPGPDEGESLSEGGEERAKPISRTRKTGPKIAFSSRVDEPELAWIEGNSIIINSGHSSYEKANANTNALSRTLHNLFSIGSAIQKHIQADENRDPDPLFLDKWMLAWGESK